MKISRSTVAGLTLGAAGIAISLGIFIYQESAARTARCQIVLDQARSDLDLLTSATTRVQTAQGNLAQSETELQATTIRRDKADTYFDALTVEQLAGQYADILRRAKTEYLARFGTDAFQRTEFGIVPAYAAWSEVVTDLGYPSNRQQRQGDARLLMAQGFEGFRYLPDPLPIEHEVDAVIAALDDLARVQAMRRDSVHEAEFQNTSNSTALIDRLTAAAGSANSAMSTARTALSTALENETAAQDAAQRSCAAVAPQCGAESVPQYCTG